jgi:hypothetical protein
MIFGAIIAPALLPSPAVALNGTVTLNPSADAYVSSAAPTSNFGTATTLRVGVNPTLHSYIMFNVQGLGGTPTSATLQLWAVSAGSGTSAKGAGTAWTETSITYANAPTYGTAVSTVTGITAGRWVSFNVTSLVTGNGLVAFALTSASATPISFASREDAAHAPRLIITGP